MAEVAHVGVERFAAGDDEEDRAEDDEAVPSVRGERTSRRVQRIERREHAAASLTIQGSPSTAMVTNHTTITGPNSAPTRAVPRDWIMNRPTRMTTVIGTTYGSKTCVAIVEALDRAEHRDGRRDHAVAVEQRRAEQAERDRASPRLFALAHRRLRDERQQREDAALAVVVGAHHEDQVLDRDDERQRPEDQRQHAEHVVARRRRSPCVP